MDLVLALKGPNLGDGTRMGNLTPSTFIHEPSEHPQGPENGAKRTNTDTQLVTVMKLLGTASFPRAIIAEASK